MNETDEYITYYISGININTLTLDKNTKTFTQNNDIVTASKIANADGSISLAENQIESIDGVDVSGRYYFINSSVDDNYHLYYDYEKNKLDKIKGDINNNKLERFMYIGQEENMLYAETYPGDVSSGYIHRIELKFEEE